MASHINKDTANRDSAETADRLSSISRRDAPPAENDLAEHLTRKSPGNIALKTSVIYAVVALLWIFATDFLVETALPEGDTQALLQTTKGFLFVALTALALYVVLRAVQNRELNMAARLRGSVAASRGGLWVWDVENDRIMATPGGDVEVGWAAAGTIRDTESWRALVHPDDWATVTEQLQALAAPGNDDWQTEQRFRTSDGGWHWFQIKGYVVSRGPDGAVRRMEGTHFSVNSLKRTQMKLERANRALMVLVAAYRAVSNGRTQNEVFAELVHALAEDPDYSLVWVGEAVEAEKRIIPVASDGPATAFLDSVTITWDDGKHGSGPSGACIRTGTPSIVEDVRNDKSAEAWLPQLDQFRIRSAVSIPIFLDDDTKFVLQLDCAEPDSFAAEEMETYELVGRVLSLALKSFDLNFRFEQSESARMQIAGRLETALHGTIAALTEVVEKRDPYTAGHQQRVAELSVAIGAEMGISGERLEGIYIGASIHDIGKIGVPTEILSKPGRLDDEEIALIRRHAAIGDGIVRNIDFGWPVEKIVHQHHERWDGSGYPQGLTGEEIAPEARIVAVADVIESMGTNRPYRPSIPWPRVLEEIRDGSGSRYEPAVVDAALRVLDRDAATFGLGEAAPAG
ncbi:MAG: HD domain-containing phosphohydrolase [Rhodospirillales bacterium]